MAQKAGTKQAGRATRSKIEKDRLLVVVDESSSSKHAVAYVARMLASQPSFQLCLMHLLPPLPPELLEFGGAEDPAEERKMDNELKAEQRQWISAAAKKAQPVLDRACTKLRSAGLPASSIRSQFSDPANEQHDVSGEILELARANECGTIVVGRRSPSWLRKLFAGNDLAQRLVQRGKGRTFWIVE